MKKELFTSDRDFMNVHTRGTVSIRNIAKTVFTAVGFLVLAIFLSSLLLLLFQLILPDGKIWRAAEEYLCFLPFWLVIPLYKAPQKDVLFPRNGASETYFLKPLLFGTLIGSILFVLCLLFPLCSDNLQLIRNSQFVPAALLPLWAAVFIQAGGEELFFRVFFQRMLKKKLSFSFFCHSDSGIPVFRSSCVQRRIQRHCFGHASVFRNTLRYRV